MIYEKVISQSTAESPFNIISILKNFKSFIKQVYKKNGPKIIKKKVQNNYTWGKISQKEEDKTTFQEKKKIEFY